MLFRKNVKIARKFSDDNDNTYVKINLAPSSQRGLSFGISHVTVSDVVPNQDQAKCSELSVYFYMHREFR